MNRSAQTEALVVGGVDYGDADRIVHLLTEQGRLTAFARGAKNSKRRFAGALDPFTTITAMLQSSKKADGMATLASAQVIDPRLAIRSDLQKIALASYVVELGARVAPEGQATDGIYHLVLAVLDYLVGADHGATIAVRRAFELRLIDALGYRPDLDRCLSCQEIAAVPHLDLVHGGILCAEHRGRGKEIGPRTLGWMRAMLEVGAFDPFGGLDPPSADRAARALTGPAGEYFASLIGRPLKSAALLEEVLA